MAISYEPRPEKPQTADEFFADRFIEQANGVGLHVDILRDDFREPPQYAAVVMPEGVFDKLLLEASSRQGQLLTHVPLNVKPKHDPDLKAKFPYVSEWHDTRRAALLEAGRPYMWGRRALHYYESSDQFEELEKAMPSVWEVEPIPTEYVDRYGVTFTFPLPSSVSEELPDLVPQLAKHFYPKQSDGEENISMYGWRRLSAETTQSVVEVTMDWPIRSDIADVLCGATAVIAGALRQNQVAKAA